MLTRRRSSSGSCTETASPLESARQRLCAQMAIDDKRQLADYIIENTGSLDALEAQVTAVWSVLCGIFQKTDKTS